MNGVMNDLVAGGRPGAGVSARRSLRDGLTGRTAGSDPGGGGSIPCPGLGASSSVGMSACLTNRRSLVGLQPRSCSWSDPSPEGAPVEPRAPQVRLLPATLHGFVAHRQSTRFLPGRLQVRRLRGPLWKDCHRRGIPFRKRVGPEGPWGFDSLSFLLEAWPSGKAAPCYGVGRRRLAGSNPAASASFRRGRVGKTRGGYPRERRFDSCRRSFLAPVVE